MSELSDEAHDKIKQLCSEGDEQAKDKNFQEALRFYWLAWDLLPQPQTDWDAATWILAAIGDANFLSGDFEAGRDNLSNAMCCPDAIGNPFLHLRLGQCLYELGDHDRAADELTRTYSLAGNDIFSHDDAKYFSFLKTRLQPPPDGWDGEKRKPWWKVW